MIVLDTHTLIWWVHQSPKLSAKAKSLLNKAVKDKTPILVPSICAWEIALLLQRDKISLGQDLDDWLDDIALIDGLRFEPLNRKIAVQSVNLPPPFHADPADRFIVATARVYNATLLSADAKIRAYPHVKCVW